MFKIDSPLMNFLNKVADIMLLNIMFLVCSIPVFTIGASFSAAYYIGFKMVKNEDAYIIKGFLKAFKENFKQGTVIWLIILIVLGIMVADYRIVLYSGIAFAQWIRIGMMAVTVMALLGAVFVFPLQARFVNSVKNTIKNAFLMALSHFPTSILLIVVYAAPVMVLYFFPQIMPVVALLGFGLIIYFKSFLLLRVFRKYESAFADSSQEAQSGETDELDSDSGIFAESDRIEREGKMVKVFRNGKFVEVPESSLQSGSNMKQ